MNKKLDLSFKVIKESIKAQNSAGCRTNGSSGCCTTYCTSRNCKDSYDMSPESMNVWDAYLQLNTGVLQY